jgi:hypothetical protein
MQVRKILLTATFVMILATISTSGYVPVTATPTAQCTQPNVDDFTNPTKITNPHLPLRPGTTLVYTGSFSGEPSATIFRITHDTKNILGVTTVVIDDTVIVKGVIEEHTIDWFAQDKFGNVWYFGEFATEYQNGVPLSHDGSWEAGVNGALPGIVMEANPKVGDFYCQENAPGIAQDQAQVLSLHKSICTPAACPSDNVLQTKETSPLNTTVEDKFFASGVGQINAKDVKNGVHKSVLVAVLH